MADAVHALLVPFATEGHINGLLGLAQCLAEHGLLITFAYPARAHALLQQRRKVPQIHPSITLHVVPDGLPTDQAVSIDLSNVEVSIAVTQKALKLLIHELSTGPRPVCCIVSDSFVPWTQDLAYEVALPRVEFWTSTATVYAMGVHLPELVTRGYLPVKENTWFLEAPPVDFIPGLPPFSLTELPYEFLMESLSDEKFQFMLRAYSRGREAHTILANSLYELERSPFDALQSGGIPIYSVGPLFPPPSPVVTTDASADDAASANSQCLKWLDRQLVSSVVYVSLGSHATLSTEETHEMALGLEASGYHFLWVIRVDAIKGDLADNLPEGFLSRTAEKGLIISWAPQTEVLKHESIGAFLTHCGWNSTLESLWGGKGMVACPRAAEQRSNARQIVYEWKVGVEMKRNKDGSFTKEAVEEAVKAIMGNPEYRDRAVELQKVSTKSVAAGGISYNNTASFVQKMTKELCSRVKDASLS